MTSDWKAHMFFVSCKRTNEVDNNNNMVLLIKIARPKDHNIVALYMIEGTKDYEITVPHDFHQTVASCLVLW